MVKIPAKRGWQGCLGAFLVGMSLLSTTGSALASSNPNPNVFPPTSRVGGKTYAEWSAAWWQRQFSITAQQFAHDCQVQQSAPVFFFDGQGAAAKCTVPQGKPLFFPVFSNEQSTLEFPCFPPKHPLFPPIFPPDKSDAALRNCTIATVNYITELKVSVDGKPLRDLMTSRYLVTSPPFNVTAIKNNALGIRPGTGRSVASGVWIMLMPLKPGVHRIHVFAKVVLPKPVGTFLKDQTFTVTVK